MDEAGYHLAMAEDLDAMERDVTPWEAGFLDGIIDWLRRGATLTPKQVDVLERMYRKYIEGQSGENG